MWIFKPGSVKILGSISAVSRVRSLILPEERLFRGMSAGSFSRTAAGNRAYKNSGQLVLFNRKSILCFECKERSIDCTSTLMFVLFILGCPGMLLNCKLCHKNVNE